MSLSAKIFLGLGLGIATGIFLGEITAPLKAVGAAYVQLLQMAVLPYIMITLMSGLGKLKYAEAVRLSYTRRQPASADLGFDLCTFVSLAAQLSQLGIRVVL